MHVGVIMSTPGMFSTLEGYHEYTGGWSVHQRDTMSTPEDTMSTPGILVQMRKATIKF